MSKKENRAKRAAVGFELNPARCINCQHFDPPIHGVPGKSQYKPPLCGQMGLMVLPHSICDLWKGKDGETLK